MSSQLRLASLALCLLAPVAGCFGVNPPPGFTPHAPYVYVGSSDGNLYAFETEHGTFAWKQPLGGEIHSTPLVEGNLVIVGAGDGALHALSTSDGHEVWKTALVAPQSGPGLFTTPIDVDGVVLVAARPGGTIYAVDQLTGALGGSYTLGHDAKQWLSLASDGQTVYVAVEGGSVYGLVDLQQVWHDDAIESDGPFAAGISGVQIGYSGTTMVVLDPTTGALLRMTELDDAITSVAADPDPHVGEDYASDASGEVYFLGPGSLITEHKGNPFGATTWIAARVSAGVFVSSASGKVASITGDLGTLWSKSLDSDFVGAPVVASIDQVGGARVIVVSRSGHLRGLDPMTGATLWMQLGTIGGTVDALPAADVP